MKAYREAEEVYRELAARRPDVYRPDLAMTLNNLGGALSELGDSEAAAKAYQAAASLYEAAAEKTPTAFLSERVMTATNLGHLLLTKNGTHGWPNRVFTGGGP